MGLVRSFCGFAPEGTADVLEHAIILSHWGLAAPENPCRPHHWLRLFGACHQYHSRNNRAGKLPCYTPGKVCSCSMLAEQNL